LFNIGEVPKRGLIGPCRRCGKRKFSLLKLQRRAEGIVDFSDWLVELTRQVHVAIAVTNDARVREKASDAKENPSKTRKTSNTAEFRRMAKE